MDSPNQHQPHDGGKYVRYTQEQVDLLEKIYSECPKPSALKRQQLVRDSPVLFNIDPKQIKVWFQNRRCREKQKKEACELQSVNWNLTAMNKLLLEENERLQKQVSNLVYANGSMKNKLHSTTAGTELLSSPPQQQRVPGYVHHIRDASNPAGLLTIAEKTLAEFLPKATGTAINWVQIVGMKPGPDSIGTVATSSNCSGIAARACDLVSLAHFKENVDGIDYVVANCKNGSVFDMKLKVDLYVSRVQVAELLKDSLSWYRDCRRFDVLSVLPTTKGGTIELIHMEMYAPTTLTLPRDFWMLRYTTTLEDGSLVICERSLTSATGGPGRPSSSTFVRGEILPSGYLIRSSEDGGSILHIVHHVDLDVQSVPEVVRPIYESPKLLAQRSTLRAIRHVRELTDEIGGEVQLRGGRQPAVLRAFRQKLCRGFNDAVNGFADDGWSMLGNDVVDNVTISINTSSNCYFGSGLNTGSLFPTSSGVLCAKATMLLQNVHPALLVRFLREHRSEWADSSVDDYCAASIRKTQYASPSLSSSGRPNRQVIIPLAKAAEYDEFLEVVRIEGQPLLHGDGSSHVMHLLQLCTGIDENAVDACAELIFTSTDESFADNAPLLPSGFRVIPLDTKPDGHGINKTLDLTSNMETGTSSKRMIGKSSEGCASRSILVIAFQFTFENPFLGNVAAMARQFVHSVMGSVQRVSMAITPTRSSDGVLLNEANEAFKLSCLIFQSYRIHVGVDLFRVDSNDTIVKQLWNFPDAIMCCSVITDNASPVFTFANQAGLDFLETNFGALQSITLEKVLDEAGQVNLFAAFSKIMQMGISHLPAGRCTSSMGRTVSYDAAIAWKVVSENSTINHCLAFKFLNWCFI